MRTQPILKQVNDAAAGDRRIDCKIGCGAEADDERTGWLHLHDLAVAFELPGSHRAARELTTQTRVVEQLARMIGAAMPVEIGRRRRGREALLTRPDGNGNHVLLEPLVIADPRIA